MTPSSIAGSIALLKEAGVALQAAGKIDLWTKVAGLQAQLIDMQGELATKDEQIRDLQRKLTQLHSDNSFSSRLSLQGHWYIADGDPFPLCMACWDKNHAAIHLQEVGDVMSGHRMDCPVCKGIFVDVSKAKSKGQLGSIRVVRG
jgi:hypothetical protein